jgi:hypothetical protein
MMTDTVIDFAVTPTINEESLRSARFRGGEPVILEGVTYYLPKPNIEYLPIFSGGQVTESRAATDLGPGFETALTDLDDDDSEKPFLNRMVQVGAALLTFNYNLDDDALGRLLIFRPNDEANQEFFKAVIGTARGTYAEKQSPAI